MLVAVFVALLVPVKVPVLVAVEVAVLVAVLVPVLEAVEDAVFVAVLVAVLVAVFVAVLVAVEVAVGGQVGTGVTVPARGEYQTSLKMGPLVPPMAQIWLLKTTDVCPILEDISAVGVVLVQLTPSMEYQTLGLEKPAMIHMALL